MAANLSEVIDEPSLDSSRCTIYTENSDEIKLHYKLKYPGTYTIPTNTMLELLDNEKLYSELENSVKSFVTRARQIHNMNKNGLANNCPETKKTEGALYDNSWNTFTLNTEKNVNKGTDLFEIPASSTDFTVYDSVHSIKVPLRTYEKIHGKSSRHAPYHHKTPGVFNINTEVNQQMGGLVFERIEQSVPLPLKYKHVSSKSRHGKKDKSLAFSSYGKQQMSN